MLESLYRRPRGKTIAARLARVTRGAIPAWWDTIVALERYEPPHYVDGVGEATGAVLDRLVDGDIAAILAAADDEWRAYYDSAVEAERRFLPLHYAAHWGVEPALTRTRLPRVLPPEHVHAMARGPLAAAGGLWFADLIVDVANRAGVSFRAGTRVLDFGCSSGRVLGALAAWRQDVDWIGCDPNAEATAWAQANLADVTVFTSPQEPPLDLDAASLDIVYAVSVWSHFGEGQAIRWLAEMRRVLKPGGVLILTAQGFPSLSHYWRHGKIDLGHAHEAVKALVSHGHKYLVSFGEDGDWGVKHPEWGMAYMSWGWVVAQAAADWSIAMFEPARIDANQDLVVLVRG